MRAAKEIGRVELAGHWIWGRARRERKETGRFRKEFFFFFKFGTKSKLTANLTGKTF